MKSSRNILILYGKRRVITAVNTHRQEGRARRHGARNTPGKNLHGKGGKDLASPVVGDRLESGTRHPGGDAGGWRRARGAGVGTCITALRMSSHTHRSGEATPRDDTGDRHPLACRRAPTVQVRCTSPATHRRTLRAPDQRLYRPGGTPVWIGGAIGAPSGGPLGGSLDPTHPHHPGWFLCISDNGVSRVLFWSTVGDPRGRVRGAPLREVGGIAFRSVGCRVRGAGAFRNGPGALSHCCGPAPIIDDGDTHNILEYPEEMQ